MPLAATIDERQRIAGTRISIYDVLTYAEGGYSVAHIAVTLDISSSQVKVALDYIEQHKEEVTATYQRILERIERGNPPEVEAKRRETHERLMQMIREKEVRRNGT